MRTTISKIVSSSIQEQSSIPKVWRRTAWLEGGQPNVENRTLYSLRCSDENFSVEQINKKTYILLGCAILTAHSLISTEMSR